MVLKNKTNIKTKNKKKTDGSGRLKKKNQNIERTRMLVQTAAKTSSST